MLSGFSSMLTSMRAACWLPLLLLLCSAVPLLVQAQGQCSFRQMVNNTAYTFDYTSISYQTMQFHDSQSPFTYFVSLCGSFTKAPSSQCTRASSSFDQLDTSTGSGCHSLADWQFLTPTFIDNAKPEEGLKFTMQNGEDGREVLLTMQCGEDTSIASVTENPSKRYNIFVTSPAACALEAPPANVTDCSFTMALDSETIAFDYTKLMGQQLSFEASGYTFYMTPCGYLTSVCGSSSSFAQVPTSGSGCYSLGQWSTTTAVSFLDIDNPENGISLAVTGGDNGRAVILQMQCASNMHALVSVSEPLPLVYEFIVHSTFACGYSV